MKRFLIILFILSIYSICIGDQNIVIETIKEETYSMQTEKIEKITDYPNNIICYTIYFFRRGEIEADISCVKNK